MTQHPPPATDRPGSSTWWLGLFAILPIACCVGLPLLFAAGVTAGSGVVLGGVAGGALMLASFAIVGIWATRRRSGGSRPTDTCTAAPSSRDG